MYFWEYYLKGIFFWPLQEFTGYTDNKTLVRNTINGTMAKYMKIVPIFQVGQNVTCLKLEVYGCKSGLFRKLSH